MSVPVALDPALAQSPSLTAPERHRQPRRGEYHYRRDNSIGQRFPGQVDHGYFSQLRPRLSP